MNGIKFYPVTDDGKAGIARGSKNEPVVIVNRERANYWADMLTALLNSESYYIEANPSMKGALTDMAKVMASIKGV